ncbi:hypothetical protein SGPA1_12778 [Streptomyces misionensis JCM 4497]
MGRPVQPQRLGQRLQQLDGDDERAVPGEGHGHLERQRQLSQQPGARRQTQRQWQQLGRDHPEERQYDLAHGVLFGELTPRSQEGAHVCAPPDSPSPSPPPSRRRPRAP